MIALYSLLLELFPRRLRQNHGDEMRLVFRNLVDDPEVSDFDVAMRVVRDLRYLIGSAVIGGLLGVLVVLLWYVVRSDVMPYDPTAGAVEICVLFVLAGFVGALRSGSVLGGLLLGLSAGLISSITIPADYVLFGVFPADDLALDVIAVVLLVSLGAISFSVLRRLLPSTGGVRSPSPRA